jgi:hypothetical protein
MIQIMRIRRTGAYPQALAVRFIRLPQQYGLAPHRAMGVGIRPQEVLSGCHCPAVIAPPIPLDDDTAFRTLSDDCAYLATINRVDRELFL